ncbi:unnamed protein product [Mytilus coruscus]|uniref:THAP-type domain-containing protein n=1 Tax=Mytilus coruscus TaxID=42192 RepID=A0A6J8EFL6_MYTCO|nr:unnamed protein product [Mytilus coruscus]
MSNRKQKHSSNYWCVVPGCTSDSKKKNNIIKYPWMENVTFHAFSTTKKNKRPRLKWIAMIRRPLGYEPLPHHRVCSSHFVQDNNVPELFQWNSYGVFDPQRSIASIVKRELDLNAGKPTVDDNNNPEPETGSLVTASEQPIVVVNNQQDDHSYSRASTTIGTMSSTFIDTGVQTDLTLTDIDDILLENDQLKKH